MYYLPVDAAIFNLQTENRTIFKLLKFSQSVVTCDTNTVPSKCTTVLNQFCSTDGTRNVHDKRAECRSVTALLLSTR